jgi:hypothetical protein
VPCNDGRCLRLCCPRSRSADATPNSVVTKETESNPGRRVVVPQIYQDASGRGVDQVTEPRAGCRRNSSAECHRPGGSIPEASQRDGTDGESVVRRKRWTSDVWLLSRPIDGDVRGSGDGRSLSHVFASNHHQDARAMPLGLQIPSISRPFWFDAEEGLNVRLFIPQFSTEAELQEAAKAVVASCRQTSLNAVRTASPGRGRRR